MLNRTHFKRLGDDKQYFLAQDLNWYDREIVLTDTRKSIQGYCAIEILMESDFEDFASKYLVKHKIIISKTNC